MTDLGSNRSDRAAGAVRPFHFMVIFWGRRYREYFVDLCLPSLLAPNNLPLLRAADGHRFFMATTKEDWAAIETLPIMERLRRHATPAWVEIDSPAQPPALADALATYARTIRHQEVCYRKLVEAAYDPSAYGSLLGPDVLVSDGMVASMVKWAGAGHHLVLRPALRQVEEDVLADLDHRGLLGSGAPLSATAGDLAIPPQVAADLAACHLHPELFQLEEGSPGQPPTPPFRYWRVPDRGIILRTFFALPVLMDYAVVSKLHAQCLDRDAFENIYFRENFGSSRRVHAVQDSDEFSVLSLTPRSVNYAPPRPVEAASPSAKQHFARLLNIRRSLKFYTNNGCDKVRRKLFDVSFRWHTAPIDEVWMQAEREVDRLMEQAVGDYYAAQPLLRMIRHPRYILLELVSFEPIQKVRALAHLIVGMLRGLFPMAARKRGRLQTQENAATND